MYISGTHAGGAQGEEGYSARDLFWEEENLLVYLYLYLYCYICLLESWCNMKRLFIFLVPIKLQKTNKINLFWGQNLLIWLLLSFEVGNK